MFNPKLTLSQQCLMCVVYGPFKLKLIVYGCFETDNNKIIVPLWGGALQLQINNELLT